MADVAQLGFAVDTAQLKDGAVALTALVPAAEKAEKSSSKLSNSLDKVNGAADNLSRAAQGLNSAVEMLTKVFADQANAVTKAAAGIEKQTSASNAAVTVVAKLTSENYKLIATYNTQSASMYSVSSASMTLNAAMADQSSIMIKSAMGVQQLDAHMIAYRNTLNTIKPSQNIGLFDEHMTAYRANIMKTSGVLNNFRSDLKFSAREGLNFSRQFADIGVTAAMGMSPFMIAIQQGPQLFDIIQEKAIASGTTIGNVFKALGVVIWTALAPLMPFILGLAAAVAVIAAAWGLATRQISSSAGDVTKSMELTKNQTTQLKDHIERLKDNKINVNVTGMDTFKAFFVTIGQYLSEFATRFSWIGQLWTATLDGMTKYGVVAFKAIVGTAAGAFEFIRATWRQWPAAFADIYIQATNFAIRSLNDLGEFTVNFLNKFGANFKNVKMPEMANPFQGAATAGITAFVKGYDDAGKAVDRFGERWKQNAVKIAQQRVLVAVGPAGGGAAAGGKTDAEKFADLLKSGQNDVSTQLARAAAAGLNLTAEAAATLEEKTKLLNAANSQGIKLTDGMKAKIDALAASYGKAKAAADNAEWFAGAMRGADKQIASLQAATREIGVYGVALSTMKYEQQLLGDAIAKGIVLDDAQTAALKKKAAAMAEIDASNQKLQFFADLTRSSDASILALQQEAQMIGMNADQVTRLKIENELLAQAKAKNIDLSPADIATIRATADAQATLENMVRKTREAYEFGKETFKGFFTDLKSNLQQGQTLFEAFANSILNSLNRIADKLLDSALNGLFNGLFGSLGGGGGGGVSSIFTDTFKVPVNSGAFTMTKNGNAFASNGVQRFAKGSPFTGKIYDHPTMFRFGNGGALGQMGEAGPEAVMPLKRGADGSLGVQMYGGASGGSQGSQKVQIIVGTEEGPMFRPTIKRIAQDQAVDVVQQGLQSYDQSLPTRVREIANDDRMN